MGYFLQPGADDPEPIRRPGVKHVAHVGDLMQQIREALKSGKLKKSDLPKEGKGGGLTLDDLIRIRKLLKAQEEEE